MPVVNFPSHVAWLSAHRGQALRETLVSEEIRLSVKDALHALMEADPSPNKVATQWLCETYIARGFRWEDIAGGQNSKAANTLRAFGMYRKQLAEGISDGRRRLIKDGRA